MSFFDLSNPYSVFILVAVAVYFTWVMFKPKSEKHEMNHPGKKELHKIYKDSLDESLRFLGANMRTDLWYNSYPCLTIKRVAYLVRIYNQAQINEWNALTQAEKTKLKAKGEKEPKPKEEKYLVFKGYTPGLLNAILYLIGFGQIRVLVKKDQIEKVNHTFYFKEGLTPRTYGKIWIVDKAGKEFMDDVAWKWEAEDIMEQQINFSKRVSFLSPQLGASIARAEANAEIEKAKYEGIKKSRYT